MTVKRGKEAGEKKPVVVAEIIPEEPVELVVPERQDESSLFEDLGEVPEDALVPVPSDGIPALDSDLTPDEKQEFIRLLNKEIPLSERATLLAVLARFKDQKRAAVGLRALIEISELTGMRGDRPTESAPMFVFPADTRVSINVVRVIK